MKPISFYTAEHYSQDIIVVYSLDKTMKPIPCYTAEKDIIVVYSLDKTLKPIPWYTAEH